MRRLPPCAIAFFAAWLCVASTALAEGFRIQTRVYKDNEEAPISQNLTLFRGGVVYDYLSAPTETTIFDRPRGDNPGRFVLLDTARQVQTEVSLDRIKRFMSNLQLWAAAQEDPFIKFLADPTFTEEFDSTAAAWTYGSRFMTYQVKASPAANPDTFQQYDAFSEWFVRLNTMLTIKNRPPYGLGRLDVNAQMRGRREIPTEVRLTVDSPNRFFRRQSTFRSEHQLTSLLSQSDHARIAETETQLVRFKRVDLEEYLKSAVK